MKRLYPDLMGLTKKDLIEKIGDDFNFYPDTIWIYLLNKSFLGKKTYLIIRFDDDIVKNVVVKKTYGNIDRTRL